MPLRHRHWWRLVQVATRICFFVANWRGKHGVRLPYQTSNEDERGENSYQATHQENGCKVHLVVPLDIKSHTLIRSRMRNVRDDEWDASFNPLLPLKAVDLQANSVGLDPSSTIVYLSYASGFALRANIVMSNAEVPFCGFGTSVLKAPSILSALGERRKAIIGSANNVPVAIVAFLSICRGQVAFKLVEKSSTISLSFSLTHYLLTRHIITINFGL
ncbi:hypothetical protein BKA70DRAFT_1221742 [Coprinopsis sp. MPI-PUGE-AT-0042]|nr:hypothetical protein BKA70DRAFT_1221742 [Coprinopsis sp. MPI-PUGE-AT-0042]